MPDSIPAIVDKDLFEEVQQKIKKNSRAPARHKAEDDYLLTTHDLHSSFVGIRIELLGELVAAVVVEVG